MVVQDPSLSTTFEGQQNHDAFEIIQRNFAHNVEFCRVLEISQAFREMYSTLKIIRCGRSFCEALFQFYVCLKYVSLSSKYFALPFVAVFDVFLLRRIEKGRFLYPRSLCSDNGPHLFNLLFRIKSCLPFRHQQQQRSRRRRHHHHQHHYFCHTGFIRHHHQSGL